MIRDESSWAHPADEMSEGAGESWLLRVLVWDGSLPLLVVAAVLLARLWVAAGISPLVVIVAAIVAALIRAHLGWDQIARACGGRTPIGRQVLLSLAIVVLLVFDGVVGMLAFVPNPPWQLWLLPLGAWLFYLLLIVPALRPLGERIGSRQGE
jgi:hypothetical protein